MQRLMQWVISVVRPLRVHAGWLLATAAALVVVLGPFAMLRDAERQHLDVSWDEALYATFGLFTFASNRIGYPQDLVARVLYFAAPSIAASAILGGFVRLLEERGSLWLGAFQGHVVIGGLGNLGTTLARHLERHRHSVIAIERRGDAPSVLDLRAAGGAVVLVGDMTAAGVLRRARCQHAARVFFVSQSDVANLDAAFQVRRIAGVDGIKRPPVIFAHVYDAALGDALEGQLHERHPHDARIVPFNSYRFAAKALIGDLLREQLLPSLRLPAGARLARTAWPESKVPQPQATHGPEALEEDRRRLREAFTLESEGDPEGVRPSHLTYRSPAPRYAIIGLGRFGQAVVRELLLAAPTGSRFLVVERSDAHLRAAMEHLDGADPSRFDHIADDATSSATLARIVAFAPTAAIVCTDNDLSNLRLAVGLGRSKLRAVMRMSGPDASELSRGLDEKGVTVVALSRLFRAAIPILTHERRLRACLNLDFNRTAEVDHLFYLAEVTDEERTRLGRACVGLDELPKKEGTPPLPPNMVLVWHRAVGGLAV